MKIKMDLDIKAKDKAEFELETLKADLDLEGIPKCPICGKWFPNNDVIKGHMDIVHNGNGQNNYKQVNKVADNEGMENSEQSGYGITEDYQLVAVQCKKCDETLQNNHLLRIHMRKHTNKDSQILKCINCEFETTEENIYLNHIVDNHSTVHICQTCDRRFNTKKELLEHMENDHGLNKSKTGDVSQQVEAQNKIKCYSCGTMLANITELMSHKKQKHWKEKKCPYFHAVGRGCRFPDYICFNIHWPQEQQRGRGQMQRAGAQELGTDSQMQWAGGQVQGAGGQMQGAGGKVQGAGGQLQGAGGQTSWAGVTRGQGHNAREKIDCREGDQCSYFRQGDCRYRHNQTNQTFQSSQSRQTRESESSSLQEICKK